MASIDYRQIVEDFYVSNIKNRLRELETADDDEQTRWIWELIQNAKDCSKELVNISEYTTKFKAVDIKIEYDEKARKVIFKHNGIPFTNETLYSLMYKYSSKNDKEESTGRFGTGFMTSHTLSRIVYIKAPFLLKNENNSYELKYVDTTVFREGSNEIQFREEFKKMEKSRKLLPYDKKNENFKWTTFTYHLNDKGIHSAELGIQSLYKNIKKVFLLCDKINSIQINNKELINSSMVSTKSLKTFNDQKSIIFEKKIKDEKFIVASYEDFNQQYSEKYSKDQGTKFIKKNLNFDIIIPVDQDNQFIDTNSKEICIFCTFPLIGSENFQFPYLINCPVFETSTERKGLILDGDDYENSTGILTNTGLNRLILNKSIDLFSNILDYFIENNYSNYSIFSNRINSNKIFNQKIKSILENKPIVHDSSNQLLPLKKIIFLDFDNIQYKKKFYDLASSFYLNIASFDDCIKWNNKIWEELSILKVEDFVKNIQSIGNKNNSISLRFPTKNNFFENGLNSLQKKDFDLLNSFYTFLLNEETNTKSFDEIARNSKFLKEKIILNSNCKFVYLMNLKSDSKFSKDMKKIMKQCEPWKDSIIHPKINSFNSIIPEKTIDEAIQKVNNYVLNNKNNINVLLSFAKFVIKDVKKRKKIYDIAKFFIDSVPKKIYITKIDQNIWEKVDYYLLIQIKEKISSMKSIELESLKYFNKFYKLYQQTLGKTDFLVPNYNLQLKKANQLQSLSKEIPKILLDKIKTFYNFDAYIHPSVNNVTLKKEVDLDYFINLFKSFFYSNNKLIKEKLFAILSIFPPENKEELYNFQMKIKEIAQFFFNTNITESKTNIKDGTFWKTVDEIVIEYVTKKLKKIKTIQLLKSKLEVDEANIFKYLNFYYSIISSNYQEKKETILIPNYYGTFTSSQDLFIGKGLEEKLFDLINSVNNESDLKEKIAHPEIKCNFLKVMDFEYFIKLLNEKLSEEQLMNDKKTVDAIFNGLSIFNAQSINIFERLYVANMKNRLNEIQNPTESDKIRWPMELMQNAKDSLFSPSNKNEPKKVEINFEVTYKSGNPIKVIFSHDGPPFTENSFYGLLFKICEGKEHSKSTGKFGTGFISTHVLSKIVNISGDRIDDKDKTTGFSITLYREGIKDQDIIKDFKKMSKSFESTNKTMNLTKFEYKIDSNESRECVKLGLIHFKKHISNVLINCKEIKCVNLFENNKKTTYSASKIVKKQIENINFYQYKTFQNNNLLQQFILLKNKDKISISVEIDDDNKIKPRDKDTESLFSVFPLVGSKPHILPFFLNSSNLEPVTERNALVLHGKDVINGETTNCGKNRLILMSSIDLFKSLIEKLNEINCSNMYELTYGLLLSTSPYESFDLEWYKKNFLKEIRKEILNGVKAKTYFGNSLLLKDICFPSMQISGEYNQTFINLASRFFSNIISVDDESLWHNKLWDTRNMITIENLIDRIKSDSSILTEKNLDFLNKFLLFIWNFNQNLLYNHRIIPDMNGKFHKLSNKSENLKECKTVTNQIIGIMQSINIPWKSTHMNNDINTISLAEDKMIDAESRIIEKIKQDNELSFRLMKFVLNGSVLRQNMFDFVNELKIKHYKKPIIVTDIDLKIWEFADKYVLKQIVSKISSFDEIKVKNHINFFIKFLPVFFNYFSMDKEFINSCKIIPNANYSLCKINELCKKSGDFHDFLNPLLIEYFNIDFNKKIFNHQIAPFIESDKEESITDFLDIINEKIDSKDQEIQIIIAESVISILPENKKNIYNEPKEIFSLYHDLINSNIKELIIDDKYYLPHYWNKSKNITISYICEKVEETKTLTNFQDYFGLEDEDEAFNKLNLLYKYDNQNHKIIPNKNGDFMSRDELKADHGIKSDIIECFSLMDPNNTFILETVHSKVKIYGLDNFNILEIIQKFNQLFKLSKNKKGIDTKIKKIIDNILNENQFLFKLNEMADFDYRMRMEILINGHIDYLKNRIRDLNNATNDDFKRWPFELIQNARDCVRDSKQKVNMTFEFEDNCVNFIHNGLPFNDKTLNALLYQSSEGKDGNKLSVGRFGTGFMATHILSRKIHISGDLETKASGEEETVGFDVTINREGNKKNELIKGIDEMEKSKKINNKICGFTKFQYDLSNTDVNRESSNAKAYKQGLFALTSKIPQILIFNHSIDSIVLKTKSKTITYTANHENGPIQTVSAKSGVFDNKIHKFILFEKEFKKSNVKIQCLLQIDNDKIIANNDIYNFLFLSYPLFGNNNFCSPIIINSPDFEPEKERNKLVFQENMDSENEGKESSKNKLIISKCVKIFKQMISYVIDNKFTNLFYLCNGLKYDSSITFIQQNFVIKMREVILQFPIFQTQNGLKKFEEILIPCIDKYDEFNISNKNELYDEFYKLVSQLSINSKYILDINDCLKWNQLKWKGFPSAFNLNNLLEFISSHQNISELPIINKHSGEEYINDVILFIEKMKNCDNIFYNHKILIDMNGNLKKKDEIFYFDIPKEFIEMLDIVEYDYHKIMLHKKIEHLYSNDNINFNQFDILKAIHEISDKINNDNAINLIKFVIEGDQKREKIFDYTQKILQKSFNKVVIKLTDKYKDYLIKKCLTEMSRKVDGIVSRYLIKCIQNNFNIKSNIEIIKGFIKIIHQILTSKEFVKERIIPNKNYQLCYARNLSVDQIKNKNLINSLKTLFNYDLKDVLVHKYFIKITTFNKMNFNHLSSKLIDYIKAKSFIKDTNLSDRLEFYSIFLQNPSYIDSKITKVIDLFEFFFRKNIEKKSNLNVWSNEFTKIVTENIIEDITLYISKFSNILEIANENEILCYYRHLSLLYQFSTNNKIFPNINNDLKHINEIKLMYDSQFENYILFTLLNFFVKFDESFYNKESILNTSIEIHENTRNKFKIININYVHDIIVSFIHDHPKYNYEEFFDYIYKSNQLKVIFSDIIDEKKDKIPPNILGNLESYMNMFCSLEHSVDFMSNINYNRETGYFGEAFVYEEMKKSKKYKLVKWLALSDVPTDTSIEMNGRKYYINEKYEHYDIYAEDWENNEYYVEVKSTKFDSKFPFYVSELQFDFAIETNSNFYFAFVKNARSNPQILWLKKDIPLEK